METKERPRLTPARRAILEKLQAGAELGVRHPFHLPIGPREWVQEGGVGSGGASVDVRPGTASSLLELGVIELVRRDPMLRVYAARKSAN